MRFKVGDRVRVRTWEDLFDKFGSKSWADHLDIRCGFNNEMRRKCGDVVTIRSVNESTETYRIKEDDWAWQDEMFEKYACDQTPQDPVVIPLRDVACKERFTVSGIKMRKLRAENDGWLCVFCNPVFDSEFGTDPNYAKSEIHRRLTADTLPELEAKLGAQNLLEFNLDLSHYADKNKYLDIQTKIGIAYKALIDEFGSNKFRTGYTWMATAYDDKRVLNLGSSGLDANHTGMRFNVIPIVCLSGDIEVLYED